VPEDNIQQKDEVVTNLNAFPPVDEDDEDEDDEDYEDDDEEDDEDY
jgi:hypothetical protein